MNPTACTGLLRQALVSLMTAAIAAGPLAAADVVPSAKPSSPATTVPAVSAAQTASTVDEATTKAQQARSRTERSAICERGLQYLFGIQKDGMLGDSRPKAVTSAFILACLANGIRPDDPQYGVRLSDAIGYILKNSSQSFLGGGEEPNADHALAALALTQLVGTAPDDAANLDLYKKSLSVLEHSLRIQDMGINPEYFGGWRPNDLTRTNDRMLTAWFLLSLQGAQLEGAKVSKDAPDRALDFIAASQKDSSTEKPEDAGGFSVAANGLPVRSITAAGLATLALSERDGTDAARQWLARHPPTWYGPHFYESGFFAARGLWRTRSSDGGETFRLYFGRLTRLLGERQDADGSFPFPPGHGGPIVSMGKGYSTAMALLILSVDRGFLPVDQ